MSEVKTPKELADAVRAALPVQDGASIRWSFSSTNRAGEALTELERMAHRLMVLPLGFTFIPSYPLPPAESCAHAVERFREALLLLTKRHEVEVEIGHIEPGQCGGGIEDLPDAGELDAEYRAQFDVAIRERKAWDAIEKWQDSASASEVRNVERSTSRVLKLEKRAFSGCNGSTCTITSQVFYGAPRLIMLEAAAAWCEGQK